MSKTILITLLLIPIILLALIGWLLFMVALTLEKAAIAIVGAPTPGPIGASINECFLTHKTRPNNGW